MEALPGRDEGSGPLFAIRSDAAGAGVHPASIPVDDEGRLLDVGHPPPIRLAVGVAHIVAERGALTADFAAAPHWRVSLLSKSEEPGILTGRSGRCPRDVDGKLGRQYKAIGT